MNTCQVQIHKWTPGCNSEIACSALAFKVILKLQLPSMHIVFVVTYQKNRIHCIVSNTLIKVSSTFKSSFQSTDASALIATVDSSDWSVLLKKRNRRIATHSLHNIWIFFLYFTNFLIFQALSTVSLNKGIDSVNRAFRCAYNFHPVISWSGIFFRN